MSRVIKFRAWDGERMVILENSGLQYFDFEGSYSLGFTVEAYSEFWAHEQYKTQTKEASKFPIMQFTGLRDSDGVEIYEGDIVRFSYWFFDGNHSESELTGEVVYAPELLSYALRGVKNKEWIRHIGGEDGSSDTAAFSNWRFEGDDFRVIGNIHENPELLK